MAEEEVVAGEWEEMYRESSIKPNLTNKPPLSNKIPPPFSGEES